MYVEMSVQQGKTWNKNEHEEGRIDIMEIQERHDHYWTILNNNIL